MSSRSELKSEVHFADIPSSFMFPSKDIKNLNGLQEPADGLTNNGSCNETCGPSYSIGGLTWRLPEGKSMDDFSIFWIGLDNSAFANAVLTFNACEIGWLFTLCQKSSNFYSWLQWFFFIQCSLYKLHVGVNPSSCSHYCLIL